tara:strand:+ start:1 stop:1110 length:1110 start_codon:yes stop_codon:yes gene_type:complete
MIPQLGSLPRNTINQPTRTPTGIGFGTIPGFLTGLGINIVSAPPRGRGLTGLLSTVGDAAKEPFSQFQDAKFKEKQAADEFARDLLLKKIGQKEDQFEIVPPEVAKAELGPAYNENTLYQRNLKTNKIEAKTIGPKEVIKDAGNEYLKQIDKKAGEDDVKKIQDAETAFANANKFQGTIDTLSILANTPDDELRTGAFSELRTSLTKIGRELGLEVDLQNVELAELLRTVGGKVAIESLQGFKGAISNKELDFVQSINPGLNMSKEGIKLQLALLNRGNQISKKYYTEVISPFVEKNGGLRGTLNGKTFRQLQVEFYENNPFVTDEIRNKIASVQNKIDPKYKKNIITDNGINYIVVGDKVFKLPNQGG